MTKITNPSNIEYNYIESFGFLPDGTEIFSFKLKNKTGAECTVTNYGATVTSLKIPVENGKTIDVVLGFDTVADYVKSFSLQSPPYFGATIGRFAGRLSNGQFLLNEKLITVNKNHNNHCLHGGKQPFSQKVWTVKTFTHSDNPSIVLEYCSADNEEGFPGKLDISVTYTLAENNEFTVEYSAISNEDTVVNLTHHSYFNLDGHENNIDNLEMVVHSKKILETNAELIPTGNFINLEQHPFDFSKMKKCPAFIDNTFVIENENAASLFSEKNRLKMTVFTNQPSVHIYVGGNCFNEIQGKENANYHGQSGICFETQNFPDAPNHINFPNAILKKGGLYNNKTTFKFENY